MKRLLLALCCCGGWNTGVAALPEGDGWQAALAQMPLGTNVTELNRANCVRLMLDALRSNSVVKALIFMPGGTDEFDMFGGARATLTNSNPTLLDAVAALTNQTRIRVTFRAPLLMLRLDRDTVEPLIRVTHQATADKLGQMPFLPQFNFYDRDWDYIQPILRKKLKMDVHPWRYSYDSWHFYRHSLAGYDLTGWEALQAIALAGKTSFTAGRRRVGFEPDLRIGGVKEEENPHGNLEP